MNPYIIFHIIAVLAAIAIYFIVRERKDDEPDKKIHKRKISFSVDLNDYYRVIELGFGYDYECKICLKCADSEKQIITHLNHDHLGKEFMDKRFNK